MELSRNGADGQAPRMEVKHLGSVNGCGWTTEAHATSAGLAQASFDALAEAGKWNGRAAFWARDGAGDAAGHGMDLLLVEV